MIDDVEFIPVRVSLLLLLYDARRLSDDYYKIDALIEGSIRTYEMRTRVNYYYYNYNKYYIIL